MNNYAIVDDQGNVINVTVWDGDETNWQPPEGTTAILVPEGEPAEPGGTYDGKTFTPVTKTVDTPTDLDVLKQTLLDKGIISAEDLAAIEAAQ